MSTHLAPRELEYVQYIAEDLSEKQIARLMALHPVPLRAPHGVCATNSTRPAASRY